MAGNGNVDSLLSSPYPVQMRSNGNVRLLFGRHALVITPQLLALPSPIFVSTVEASMVDWASALSASAAPPRRNVQIEQMASIVTYAPSQMKGRFPRCSICQTDFVQNNKVAILHGNEGCAFHQNCIRKWFRYKSTCPNCRTDCAASTV